MSAAPGRGVPSVTRVDPQRESRIRVADELRKRRRRQLEVPREHARERVPERMPGEPLVERVAVARYVLHPSALQLAGG